MSVWTDGRNVSMSTVGRPPGSATCGDEWLPQPKIGTPLIRRQPISSELDPPYIAIGETPNSQWCSPASSAIHRTTPSATAPIVAPQFGTG
jgi:hypothetical protein